MISVLVQSEETISTLEGYVTNISDRYPQGKLCIFNYYITVWKQLVLKYRIGLHKYSFFLDKNKYI